MKRKARTSPRRTVDVAIGELSPGGHGVAIHTVSTPDPSADGGERRAIFVPNVALGERVRVSVDFSSRPARGTILEILEPSPDRIAPACRHVGSCGGCDWMHLSPPARQSAHASMVRALLQKDFPNVVVHANAAAEDVGYRTRTRLHIDARGGRITIGMFGRGTHAPVLVDTCIVLAPVLDAARRALPSWLEGARGRGEARLSLGAPGAARKAVVDLTFDGQLPSTLFGRLERAVTNGELGGARVFDGPVKIPAVIGDPTPWIVGGDDKPLRLAPGGFSQATEAGNRKLVAHVVDLVDALTHDGDALLELYAGAGNLTVMLARTRKVVAVEADRDAASAARANLEARGLHASLVCADAGAHPISRPTKLVVLDPPRTGAREVVKTLAARPGPAVIYVSCDPPTLCRDLQLLAGAGYVLHSCETFEMFPQTSHVETVAALVHASAKPKRR